MTRRMNPRKCREGRGGVLYFFFFFFGRGRLREYCFFSLTSLWRRGINGI